MTDILTVPTEALPYVLAADTDAHMTCRQMAILALVAEHPGQSNGPIATTLSISKPVVTRAADRLVLQGLMTRVEDQEDRRKVCLTITAAGLRLLNSIRAAQA